MDIDRLYQILGQTTAQYRKGERFTGTPELVEQAKAGVPIDKIQGGGTLEIFAMPHVDEAGPEVELVDLFFLTIGVKKDAALAIKEELIEMLRTYPNPKGLSVGLSYIEVGADLGDQGAAFQLFALGKVLGIWNVVLPGTVGIVGDEATELAGRGFILITGFTEKAK